MQTEQIGNYEVEFGGEQIADSEEWAAYAAVYGRSPNPMHRNSLLPHQRVAVESVFHTEAEAASAALKVAQGMLEHR